MYQTKDDYHPYVFPQLQIEILLPTYIKGLEFQIHENPLLGFYEKFEELSYQDDEIHKLLFEIAQKADFGDFSMSYPFEKNHTYHYLTYFKDFNSPQRVVELLQTSIELRTFATLIGSLDSLNPLFSYDNFKVLNATVLFEYYQKNPLTLSNTTSLLTALAIKKNQLSREEYERLEFDLEAMCLQKNEKESFPLSYQALEIYLQEEAKLTKKSYFLS